MEICRNAAFILFSRVKISRSIDFDVFFSFKTIVYKGKEYSMLFKSFPSINYRLRYNLHKGRFNWTLKIKVEIMTYYWNSEGIVNQVRSMICVHFKVLLYPSCLNPGRREKIKLNFYFHTSLWCLKRFYEGLKGLHKTFWGTTKKCGNKNST